MAAIAVGRLGTTTGATTTVVGTADVTTAPATTAVVMTVEVTTVVASGVTTIAVSSAAAAAAVDSVDGTTVVKATVGLAPRFGVTSVLQVRDPVVTTAPQVRVRVVTIATVASGGTGIDRPSAVMTVAATTVPHSGPTPARTIVGTTGATAGTVVGVRRSGVMTVGAGIGRPSAVTTGGTTDPT
ncbi:hypothetical protein PV726_22675, partial [Streptomyces europaeiscabiei]|nr:hypothetical protein [Streptomyces europaeiscabiei]